MSRAVTRSVSKGWRHNLLTSEHEALALAKSAKRVAVLGIKTEKQAQQPAFYGKRQNERAAGAFQTRANVLLFLYPSFFFSLSDLNLVVPKYLQSVGVKVVPVPVYFPEVTSILSEQVYRKIADVPDSSSIDIVDVFRRPKDLDSHLQDLLEAKPKAVWLQSGITNLDFEEALAQAGIKVVSNRCLLVEHQRATQPSNL